MTALDTVAMILHSSVLIFTPPPEIVRSFERRVQPQPRQCVALRLSHALREHKTSSEWSFGVVNLVGYVYSPWSYVVFMRLRGLKKMVVWYRKTEDGGKR